MWPYLRYHVRKVAYHLLNYLVHINRKRTHVSIIYIFGDIVFVSGF